MYECMIQLQVHIRSDVFVYCEFTHENANSQFDQMPYNWNNERFKDTNVMQFQVTKLVQYEMRIMNLNGLTYSE